MSAKTHSSKTKQSRLGARRLVAVAVALAALASPAWSQDATDPSAAASSPADPSTAAAPTTAPVDPSAAAPTTPAVTPTDPAAGAAGALNTDGTPVQTSETHVLTEAEQQAFFDNLDKQNAQATADQQASDKLKTDSQRAQCQQAMCAGAPTVADPSAAAQPSPCANGGDANYKSAYCNGNSKYPNPYALADVSRDEEPHSACYYYLSALADKNAQAAIQKNPKLADADQFKTPKQVWDAEKGCAPEAMPDGTYYAMKALMLGPGAQDDGKKYCQMVIPSKCIAAGGKEVTLPGATGKPLCQFGSMSGVLIDPSCLDDPKKLAFVKAALASVQNQGQSCLAKMTPQYADALNKHLNGPPQTQVCCGSTCKTSNKGFSYASDPLTPTEGAEAATDLPVPAAVRLNFDNSSMAGSLKGDAASTNFATGALFHEFLHRVGMPKNPMHNFLDVVNPYQAASDPDSCKDPYSSVTIEACFQKPASDPSQPPVWAHTESVPDANGNFGSTPISKCYRSRDPATSGKLLPWAPWTSKLPPTPQPFDGQSGYECIFRNPCPATGSPDDGIPVVMPNEQLAWGVERFKLDPVYACNAACYGFPPGLESDVAQLQAQGKSPPVPTSAEMAKECTAAQPVPGGPPFRQVYDSPVETTGAFGNVKKSYSSSGPLQFGRGENVCAQ